MVAPPITKCINSNNAKAIEKSKEIVKQANIKKYIEILESENAKNIDVWNKAAIQVQDSLKIDSIARTNYAKGAQMVRDSIKNANLADTTKMVIKTIKK